MYGERLRTLRLEHGYTMEQVGQFVGIKKSSYASYEAKYRQPPIDKLKSFSKLYGVSVDYILGLTDQRNSTEYLNTKFKEVCLKRGLHWDGMEIPEDVIVLVEKVLNDAVDRCFDGSRQIEEIN
ncbi:transcriptional regulator with XRE-family HTH domain [Ureibacillus xyleni]|uniref:Transcriptional regulator with XRE-family HTH domain n=1 Tax=Ureibacillus xyleni TaxID=614648 RepID=A0A285T3I8_9BACL|nr:helix-turn-helix transcriptional regulator [Ureibacillus xyleni]SOC15839.1 transcriptional regulator with XRE-family HTH domain [Ureibacillus xyleni]